MNIKMKKCGSASQADVKAIEDHIGTSLPREYRSFLTAYDGAEPETNVVSISEKNASGVNKFIPARDILRECEGIESIPRRAIPIAWDGCGNYFILDITTGEVLFWDHETADLTGIADSFEGFLSALRPFNDDEVELRPGQVKSAWVDPAFLRSLGGD